VSRSSGDRPASRSSGDRPASGTLGRSRLRPGDLAQLAATGLRTRRLRASLCALGVAIGIAAMVAVLGISEASRAQLIAQLDRLGANLLTASPGRALDGGQAVLPRFAPAMAARIGQVQRVSAIGEVGAAVYRNDRIPPDDTGAITVYAARPDLLTTLGGGIAAGRFLSGASASYPTVVLGAATARQLGVDRADGTTQLWLGRHWFTVVGILEPIPLAPELDRAALIGFPIAHDLLGADGSPVTIYLRADPDDVPAVAAVLARTVDPAHPEQVEIARPTDALAARAAAKTAFTGLLLGLGAVAVLVGGLGIANVMVVAVLERRTEIGVRRALGATRGQIGLQFLAEALLLSLLGGAGGVALGALLIAAYAHQRHWPAALPPLAVAGGIGTAVAIGAVAGLYPALRAARLTPTEALRAT
jgi:putative ABC transport system permease protein